MPTQPHFMSVSDDEMHAEFMEKRQRRADLSSTLMPYVDMLMQWLQAHHWCYTMVGSQAMRHVISDDSRLQLSQSDELAFAPNDWDIWLLVSGEKDAISASTELCRYFEGTLLPEMRRDKALRRKRIYTVANSTDCVVPLSIVDIPYPARWTGIALGERKQRYIDVQVVDLGQSFKPDRFKSAYVQKGTSCLNLEGCITSLELIKSKRKHMGYNIDGIRRRVFDAYLTHSIGAEKVASWYQGLAKTFEDVFSGTDFLARNKGTIGRMLLRSLEHSDAKALEDCEARLIESLRPMVNATVQAIERKLNEHDIGHIFITGGDAMRRYDSAIKVSKDIDTKLYVSSGNHVRKALHLALVLCAKAVTMMIERRSQILPKDIRKVINGTPVGFIYNDSCKDNVQFRLRFLPAERDGRPRLISIDYRMKIRVGTVLFNHNIPILDVVIQRSPGSEHETFQKGTKPPIAALDWLVDDIQETWGSSSRAKQRVWANKREKNRGRLESLERLQKEGREAKSGGLGTVDESFLKYMTDDTRAPTIPDYLDLFDWATERKAFLGPTDKVSKKQKLPFSLQKLNDWRQDMHVHES